MPTLDDPIDHLCKLVWVALESEARLGQYVPEGCERGCWVVVHRTFGENFGVGEAIRVEASDLQDAYLVPSVRQM